MFRNYINPCLRHRVALTQASRYINSVIIIRPKSTRTSLSKTASNAELDVNVKPLGEKVKENAKTASYLGIILLGVGVTGTLIFAVFKELFSSRSPNNIYTAAVKKCLADYRVEDKLGLPITAYGEETRRGRRQHPNYVGFLGNDGKKHIRMKFYLQGQFHKGTANLEMVENDSGDFEYKYLLVDINDLSQTRIVLEDGKKSMKMLDTPSGLLL